MGLTLVTAPDSEPVVRTEVINHLRLEPDTEEDTLLDSQTMAARGYVEQATGRKLITQTWRLTLDCFPCEFRLPYPPLQSVTSIKYLDTDGVEQTLDTAEYEVDTTNVPGRVVLAYGKYWPLTRQTINAVRVTFVCGYGDPSDVPEELKAAIHLIQAGLYENREDKVIGTIVAENDTVTRLMGPYRVLEPA